MKIGLVGEEYFGILQKEYNGYDISVINNIEDLEELDILFVLKNDFSVIDLKKKYQRMMLVGIVFGDTKLDIVENIIKNKFNLGLFIKDKVIQVIDPLGNLWYKGFDMYSAINKVKSRVEYLSSITREQTFCLEENTGENNGQSSLVEDLFLKTIKDYSKEIHSQMGFDLKGNKNPDIRCAKTMPSFRKNGKVYVSMRQIETTFIETDDFIEIIKKDGKIYSMGKIKAAIDMPIHMKIYENFPQINYIVHTHTYINDKNIAMTDICNPCGALEEYKEIEKVIISFYKQKNLSQYKINLKGHGSIVMGSTLKDVSNIQYIKRPLFEQTN